MTRASSFVRFVVTPRALLWMAAVTALTVLLTLLTFAINEGQTPSQDVTILEWMAELDIPLLGGISKAISGLTNNYPAAGMGLAGISFLWLIGMTRTAVAFGIAGVIIGAVAFGGDQTLGVIVDRSRPDEPTSANSYPSGHVFGSTVFFGFGLFLAFHNRLKKKLLLPLAGLVVALILAVGFARMYDQDHWPSDVAAGYLLAAIWILLLIPAFTYYQRISWRTSPKQAPEADIHDCESCRIEGSIASTVVLDPDRGTATKMYAPPRIVRLLYWLAFQAKFPYEHNRAALDTAIYRRKIASALTKHTFGKDLVAHVSAVDCELAACNFITEYIPGELAENDEATREFLGQVVEVFAKAGLSVWQGKPRNPHAHTNLIRNPEGFLVIIDLESAVVTPIPGPGQWRSALRRGSLPIFDDIDFEQLRRYISTNETALETSLGVDGLAELKEDVENGERAIHAWQDSEPRIWGRLIRGVYRLFDWKRLFMRLGHAMESADASAELFLSRGIERWEAEGKISASEVASLQSLLTSGEVKEPMHHLGVHLVLSVVLAIPIPGLRSLARFLWTFVFWVKVQARRFRRRSAEGKATNVHTPLVMGLALLPLVGGAAYLASRPLRRKLVVLLMLDQMAIKLPFRLYSRLRLERLLSPAPQ